MGRIRIDLVYRHLDLSVLFDDDGEPLEIQTYTGRRTANDQPVYESIGNNFNNDSCWLNYCRAFLNTGVNILNTALLTERIKLNEHAHWYFTFLNVASQPNTKII